MSKKLTGYVTIETVAQWLGEEWSAATRMRLVRRFKSREKQTGRTLLWRDGAGRGSTYHTTESAMRECFPELFPRRDEVAEMMADEQEALHEQIATLTRRLTALACQFAVHTRNADAHKAHRAEHC